MKTIYNDILSSKKSGSKLLSILLDPDKVDFDNLDTLCAKIGASGATHILIGGSHVFTDRIDELILEIRDRCLLPIVLFPGNPTQISTKADAILFLSLLSGRNPDFLIGHHVNAAPVLQQSALEIIPTGYVLIESGSETAVAKVSQTQPLSNLDLIVNTALAGEMLGKKLIYLYTHIKLSCHSYLKVSILLSYLFSCLLLYIQLYMQFQSLPYHACFFFVMFVRKRKILRRNKK
ncbi:MAG: geranylgeranylglyceryl phosphate synthase family protein [Chitinophagaceae bacterium]|nr:MAG: geranylgeranylglyceryl phosphate synthase family protein [Chitinophagaceae bacterium]